MKIANPFLGAKLFAYGKIDSRPLYALQPLRIWIKKKLLRAYSKFDVILFAMQMDGLVFGNFPLEN